jgi:predicted transposase YbfD/YdcC
MRLLPQLPLRDRLLSGDARYCQQDLCREVVAAGGAYLLTVKANQPTLYAALVLLFTEPPPGERFARSVQCDRHGDRQEERRLLASPALAGYLDWPGAQQVIQVTRTLTQKGQTTQQVRYSITSLPPTQAPAGALLRWRRAHWHIENRLHWVRDVPLGEDASQVRSGAAPQVLAALRNAVLNLLRRWRATNIAAALRTLAWQPRAALRLLGISAP